MDKENTIGESCGVETFPLKRTSTESTMESLSERVTQLNERKYEIENKSMESVVNIRPPRDPKQSQSVATIGPTNIIIFHNHHHQPQHSSNNRHRSSSQPRLSPNVEASSSKVMHGTSRSVSQPKASQNAHFLDGFNVADCFDVRTIPDPPLPSPSNSRSRHHRRISSTVLRPISSRDVTNRKNNQITITNDTTGSDTKSSFRTRRKRKTMLLVPSPLSPEGQQKLDSNSTLYVSEKGKEQKFDAEVRREGPQINLCRDDYEDENGIAMRSPKRKKKRQSIIIPCHLPLEVDVSSSYTTSAKHLQSESHSDKNPPLGGKKEFSPIDFKSMQKLRNLVRGYCALSPGEERRLSYEAKEILSITGYAMPRKITTVDNGNKSETMFSNRRLVIQKIAPVLSQMEMRKKRDIKRWETSTECRVTKSEKSGRYRYYDIESKKKVGSQEYKRRYISILQDDRPNRLSKAHLWMNELNHESNTNFAREESTDALKVASKTGIHLEILPILEHSNSIDINRKELNHTSSDAIKQKEAFSPPMDINIVKDETVGSRDTDKQDCLDICEPAMSIDQNCEERADANTSESSEITEVSSEDTDDAPQGSRLSTPTNSTTSELAAPMVVDGAIPGAIENTLPEPVLKNRYDNFYQNKDMGRNDNTENVPLLPLPSKDVESMDPDIAAAEKRLWDKIDLALHEYSAEVMMIEQKKRRLTGAYPVSREQVHIAKNQGKEERI